MDDWEEYLNEVVAYDIIALENDDRESLKEKVKELRSRVPKIFWPFFQPFRYKGAHGGRGGGKSQFFAENLVIECMLVPGTRAVCLREVQRTLRESVKILIEDKIAAAGWGDQFEIRYDFIRTPGNGLITFQGMADHTAESIKSLEGFRIAYFEEAQNMSSRSLELLRPTIRAPGSELWFAWNPRHSSDPVDELLRGDTLPTNACVIETQFRDNPYFPSELEEERLFDRENNPARYMHIWEGAYEPQAVGALWSRSILQQHRISKQTFQETFGSGWSTTDNKGPTLERILVAIDPAIGSGKGSDEHGIVVGALGSDDRGYVLADASVRGKPDEWARAAITQYDIFNADAIVVETNQGGEMCEHVIKSVRPGIRIISVHASRGKHVRAEPISALYAMGKVSHVGSFPELEHQLCLITPFGYEGTGSPDRADALVWLFSSLFGKLTRRPTQTYKVIASAPKRLIQRRTGR